MGMVADLLSRWRCPGVAGERGGGGFVGYLNLRRQQRARRLFTALFDPILAADDPVLPHCPRPLPGLVLRADIAGLWAALGVHALDQLAPGAQTALDRRAADTLLDEVLRSPEALEWQERMAAAAVRFLDGVLTEPGDGLAAVLERLNRERLLAIRGQSAAMVVPAPLGAPFLRFVRDYLPVAGRNASVLAGCVAEGPAGHLAGVAARFRRDVGAVESELPDLPALTALHVGRQYGAVALMLRDHGRSAPVMAALTGHFTACCVALAARVVASAADGEGVLPRLGLILPAVIVAGVPDDAVCGPDFHAGWQRLAGVFEDCLAAAPGRSDAPQLLALIGGWDQLARTYDRPAAAVGEGLAALKTMLEAR